MTPEQRARETREQVLAVLDRAKVFKNKPWPLFTNRDGQTQEVVHAIDAVIAAALAEREREIERLKKVAIDLLHPSVGELAILRAQHAALVAALKEFANEDHWEQVGEKGNESDHWAWNDWRNPMDVADAALAAGKGEP